MATKPVTTPAAELERELRRLVQGEVRFDRGSRALYATDASVYRQVPIGVVIPRTENDVLAAVDVCRRFDAPILPRGCGTSLAGQCCNTAVVLDCSKYLDRIIEIDPDQRRARVQPGVVLDSLRREAGEYGLTFGPDPQTANHCTLGGMIGNDSCGVHSIMAGKTDANVEELEILLYDGTRMRVGQTPDDTLENKIAAGGREGDTYARLKAFRDHYADLIRERYPDIPRRVSGYNLPFLLPEHGFDVAKALVGSEGTCAITLGATVRLVASPPARSLLVVAYPDIFTAGDHIPELMSFGPIGLEGFDDSLINALKTTGQELATLEIIPAKGGILLIEFGGETKEESDDKAKRAMAALRKVPNAPEMKLFDLPHDETMIWNVRRDGLGATSLLPGKKHTWPAWDDAAVRPDRLGAYLRDFQKLLETHGLHTSLYGHFGHGCVHTNIDFDLESEAGLRTYREFMEEAADLVVANGGSLTGEHGDGQARGELLVKMFGEELVTGFEEFKAIWDPDWKMNPGKVVRARKLDEDLRVRPSYAHIHVDTHFQFPMDGRDFTHSVLRCVGAGECRRHNVGTMCPSFRVTHEERYSTRGRARLLFEMLEGEELEGQWRNKDVLEALDLCLACKGCKGNCPTQVDMATYKSEFLAHHYKGRLRPAHAYALGFIYWWSRLASLRPRAVNALMRIPVIPDLGKRLAGITSERPVPEFADRTFTQSFRGRDRKKSDRPEVILWPDTWNNHFLPDATLAAVEVLEAVGFQVRIPERTLCCGRPLYDFGFIGTAKRQLRQILDTLQPDIAAGVPVVGLEPSCVAVFRDEMINLMPDDKRAQALSKQTFTLGEFLMQKASDAQLPKLDRKVVLHGHCHQKALMGMSSEEAVLARMGADFETLDSGCCGLAGVFGFERDHYDTSMDIGELVLLPAVRDADKDALIVADGFSCREQIMHGTDRKPMHLAQAIRIALQENGSTIEPTRSHEHQTAT